MTSVDVKANLRDDFGTGIGISADIIDKLEVAPGFNYYFPDGGNYFHVDVDFHYNFDVGSGFTVYPLVGVTYFHAKDYNKFGFNIGAGAKYDITQRIGPFLEGKYQWVDGWDDSYFSLGVKIGI